MNDRSHHRLPFEGTIFIELVSSGLGAHDGEVVMCKTLDISQRGLSVGVDRELTIGAILQIGVELPDVERTLYLAGEVKWCRHEEGESNTRSVGFELLNASDSDIETWRDILYRKERM